MRTISWLIFVAICAMLVGGTACDDHTRPKSRDQGAPGPRDRAGGGAPMGAGMPGMVGADKGGPPGGGGDKGGAPPMPGGKGGAPPMPGGKGGPPPMP